MMLSAIFLIKNDNCRLTFFIWPGYFGIKVYFNRKRGFYAIERD